MDSGAALNAPYESHEMNLIVGTRRIESRRSDVVVWRHGFSSRSLRLSHPVSVCQLFTKYSSNLKLSASR
jgi:hypothetical protein